MPYSSARNPTLSARGLQEEVCILWIVFKERILIFPPWSLSSRKETRECLLPK